MGRRRAVGIALLGLVWACGGDTLPRHTDFRAGMDRDEIRERFGEPQRVREHRKTGAAVWGPIEDFWTRVPPGGRVEIWHYRSRHTLEDVGGTPQTGTTELYFVDGAAEVTGLAFAPDGVVYEAQ